MKRMCAGAESLPWRSVTLSKIWYEFRMQAGRGMHGSVAIFESIHFQLPGLFAVSLILFYLGHHSAQLRTELLSHSADKFKYHLVVRSDADFGFGTSAALKQSDNDLVFSYRLGDDAPFSYALAELAFDYEADSAHSIDLDGYSSIVLKLRCSLPTELHFFINTINANLPFVADRIHQPLLEKQFSCGFESKRVEIAINALQTPVWWLKFHGYEYPHADHDLSQVVGLGIGTTRLTQKHEDHRVVIESVELLGYDRRILSAVAAVVALLWSAWLTFRFFSFRAALTIKSEQESFSSELQTPGAPISQTLLSSSDKRATELMNFIRDEFNKQKTGSTFSIYLNQLRLAYCAEMLLANPLLTVSEVAYAGGYNDASYFSRLFKQHFGCPPKEYKSSIGRNLSDN